MQEARLVARPRGGVRVGAAAGAAFFLLVAGPARAAMFGPSLSLPLSGAPASVTIAQLDDGPADILAGSSTGLSRPSVSLLHNLGQGVSFTESRIETSPETLLVQEVAAGDFNGDGLTDFAVAGDDTASDPRHAVVSVYLAEDGGSFSLLEQHVLDGSFPRCLVAADVGGDGTIDLVACHSHEGPSPGRLSILAGVPGGGGSFADPVAVTVGSSPEALAVADLDGDGRVDLAVADPLEGKVFALFGGAAPGTLDAPLPLVSVNAARGLASLGASSRRLLVAGEEQATAFTVQVAPDRSASVISTLALSTGPAVSVLAADFDGDGSLEGAILAKDPNVIFVLGGASAGLLREVITLGTEPDAFAAGDLSADGRADLAVASSTADRVFVLVSGAGDLPPPALCGPQPAEGCERSTTSSLRLASGGASDRLAWKWNAPVQSEPGGDPVAEPMTFAVCLYAVGDAGASRVAQAHTRQGLCGGAPCWRTGARNAGIAYRERGASYQGIANLSVSGPERIGTQMVVRGSGAALALPDLPLPGASGLLVQLLDDRGACWESAYDSTNSTTKAGRFAGTQRAAR